MLIGKIKVIPFSGLTFVILWISLKVVKSTCWGALCGILLSLRRIINRKMLGFRQQGIIILRGNTRCHTANTVGTHLVVTDKN